MVKPMGPRELLTHSLSMPDQYGGQSASELPEEAIPKPFSGQKPDSMLTLGLRESRFPALL